jgi:hypothetical protein
MFATCQLWGYFDNQQLIGIIAQVSSGVDDGIRLG